MNTNRLEQVAVDLCKLDKEIELLRHAKNHIKNFEATDSTFTVVPMLQ